MQYPNLSKETATTAQTQPRHSIMQARCWGVFTSNCEGLRQAMLPPVRVSPQLCASGNRWKVRYSLS